MIRGLFRATAFAVFMSLAVISPFAAYADGPRGQRGPRGSRGATNEARGPKESAARSLELTILHTNDWHGSTPKALAAQTTYFNKVRAETPNVILLNGGDAFARGAYHYRFYGALEFAVMNEQRTDALVLGNNEFKATADLSALTHLMARLSECRFPVLAANVTRMDDGSYLAGTVPYAVLERGGARIAIVGVTDDNPGSALDGTALRFTDSVKRAEAAYREVAPRADVVIVLSHCGLETDKRIARALPELAAIVGAHSHTFLKEPCVVGEVPIVQSGAYGNSVGRLDFSLKRGKKGWRVASFRGYLVRVADYESDPATLHVIDSFLTAE